MVKGPPDAVRQAPTATPTTAPTGALMTICAYTGDPDQLFVPVVIAADQYSPYFDDENTIIPAPYYGCEGITGNTIDDAAREPTTVCHVTGNPAAPYEFEQYPNGETGGHEFHPGDLIPAPNRACPGPAAGGGEYVVPTPTPTATPAQTSAPTATPEPTATPDVLPDDDGADDEDRPLEDVLDDLAGSAPATTTRRRRRACRSPAPTSGCCSRPASASC